MKCLKIENLGDGQIHYIVSAKELKDIVDCTYNYAATCIRKLSVANAIKVKNWLLRKVDVDVVEKGASHV